MHCKIVCLDLAIIVCHGEIMDPFEVWGDWVISRVAEGFFKAGLLFCYFEAGGGVGVTAGKESRIQYIASLDREGTKRTKRR